MPALAVTPPARSERGRRPSWRERWLAFRNARIASPTFQRWAAGFPLTRRIARRNTRALFDLCAGFVYSQVLFACVRLDLFRILESGPRSAAELAPLFAMADERALRLLRAARSLNLVRELPDGRFALADLGAALNGNPAIAAMIEHHSMLYADLADPVALLRGEAGAGQLARYWLYADHARLGEAGDASVADYSALMGASQAFIAQDVLDAAGLGRHACLMDVGGGEGAFVSAVARRHPALRLKLFDLPAVAERASRKLAERGFGDRVEVVGGSFHDGHLPRGADAISLVRIVHDHDDPDVQALLRNVFEALPPGGALYIAEPMAGTAGAEPIGDAYFGFYLLAMGSGRARTAAELMAMLQRAGFVDCHEIPTRRPLLTRLLAAKRPAKV